MKIFLTEAGSATTVQALCTGFRKPFKLLQNFQLFQNSNMSSKVSVSSPIKTSVTNRQKRSELNTHTKESQNKNRSNLTTRKTAGDKSVSSCRSTYKSSSSKKQENQGDLKSKVSESSDGSVTSSVGSLTSSPKWSHIKKKFETVESVPNSKSSKGAPPSVTESKKSTHSNKTMKNTVTSNAENSSFIHRNKYLSNRKDIDRKSDVPVNKSETILSSRISNDKSKSNSNDKLKSNSKNETMKLTSRCASPKNSILNSSPASSTSSIHSASSSKHLSSTINPPLKLHHTNKSGSPESSAKNSHFTSPNVSSCSATSIKFDPKISLSDIPTDCIVNNSLKSSVNIANDSSNITSKNGHSTFTSNITSSVLSKKNLQDTPISKIREKQKFEDKPILAFNHLPHHTKKSETALNSKTGRKSLTSETEKSLIAALNSNKDIQVPKTKATSISNSTNNKTNLLDNIEKIRDLAKNSQQSAKTVWVKDKAGNWVKKADAEAKHVSNSKVASLRSKFMESSKDSSIPLTKSSTTSNVPSKLIQNSRPLAKSNTTSSICDNIFLDDFNKKHTSPKSTNKKDLSNDVEVSKKPNSISNEGKESSSDKVNNDLKLSIVQRAVLSYEGNLALLSPETQKRLKLVTEKVQSQTDDDKLLRSKTKSSGSGSIRNSHKSTNVTNVEHSSNVVKKTNDQKSLGEPVLPVRNFLSRYQQNKTVIVKEQKDTCSDENKKNKQDLKLNDTRSTFLADISSNLNKKDAKNSQNSIESSNTLQKTDSSTNNKSVTKLTMNFKVPSGQVDVKPQNQENDYVLQPNSSFLWRRSEVAPSEFSKSSTASSVSLTSSDYRNYYDIENYYSSLELEIEKRSENSEEHIYIDSQESNSSENYYASSVSGPYQNLSKGSQDEWTDISDDDYRKHSVSSNQSSTLKRRKNKRLSSSLSVTRSQNCQEVRKQHLNDTISFTDSSDTLINDEIGNESAFDLSDVNHLYEPVYESLGNYLLNQDEENDENCSISLSPDEPEIEDFMHCSLTSLESAESGHQGKEEISKIPTTTHDKNADNKKAGNKISQLKRHLSWTKNDIRLELSSKFNKIKIKKNGRNSTEIGLKMQDSENANVSPKKKTFIKCILRQKSAGSIPVKRSPSPKKESALFYVHLTMGREKQRPMSDSVVTSETAKNSGDMTLKARNQSDSAEPFTSAAKCNQQQPRVRKFASGHSIQRPKTPPPLPPVQAILNNRSSEKELKDQKSIFNTCNTNNENLDNSQFYSILDPNIITPAHQKQPPPYENEVLKLIHADGKCRTSFSTSVENTFDESDAPSDKSSKATTPRKLSNELNLPLLQGFQTEILKSPFEEEPLYQFYEKGVQQRATLWYSVDGSESEFEDDSVSKFSDSDYQSLKRPVLQPQLSAMDLVHGEGGQRRLWCEVPEVIESGILKTITPNDRKIQEAMFEVITSEASYLKSLNFLIEHFVQCPEFSGEYTDKHILNKRERHILFSDIQPVRDVSASLLSDLEKRWLKYIVLSDICDILYHHASKYFSVYVKYCSNQLYQERLLRELKEKRPEFVTVLKRLESNSICQGLDMHSFLMLPMQRITRLPLLLDAIFRRLSIDSPIYESCKIALATVNKIVAECNEGACKMQRMEEMLVISQQIDFKACKGLGLLSASRWLVKKGELVQLLMDNSSRRTFGRSSRWCKIQLYLFLFTDLLVVTRKKSDDSYSVMDYCPRNMLQVMPVDENTPPLPLRLPSSYRNVFQLTMLNNKEGKTIEMLLSCLLESDRTRWMNAMLPAKSENPDEKIYEEWDCPQVQCTHAYNAQQPDELSLEEADVVNVFKKMADGWFEGERIRDGIRGWFPSSHTVEIINSHVRARNLHQRYRLMMLLTEAQAQHVRK